MSMGLKVTAKQKPYPFELSTKELITHKAQIEDYKEELSTQLYELALNYKPGLGLITQQPEIKEYIRGPILEFLLRISIKTKVTNGIFYQAARIFDRYCSKRIVLREQVQLVLATCLWLSAKVFGGCNHVINNTNVPPGGRFHGPNPRARVPRLSELVQLCGGSDHASNGIYDEGMFIQMERHILDTLNWDVCEPQINNWLLNFYENNYMQLELNDTDGTFKEKLEIINLKRFLSEVSLYELKLIEVHPAILSQVIFNILSNFYPNYTFFSDLIIPSDCPSSSLTYYQNLLLDKILSLPEFTLSHYCQSPGVKQFYETLITTIIKNDTTESSSSLKTTPSAYSKHPYSPVNTPERSPVTKRTFIPTPPSSRRGSPAGVLEIKRHHMGAFTPPLTPLD